MGSEEEEGGKGGRVQGRERQPVAGREWLAGEAPGGEAGEGERSDGPEAPERGAHEGKAGRGEERPCRAAGSGDGEPLAESEKQKPSRRVGSCERGEREAVERNYSRGSGAAQVSHAGE